MYTNQNYTVRYSISVNMDFIKNKKTQMVLCTPINVDKEEISNTHFPQYFCPPISSIHISFIRCGIMSDSQVLFFRGLPGKILLDKEGIVILYINNTLPVHFLIDMPVGRMGNTTIDRYAVQWGPLVGPEENEMIDVENRTVLPSVSLHSCCICDSFLDCADNVHVTYFTKITLSGTVKEGLGAT